MFAALCPPAAIPCRWLYLISLPQAASNAELCAKAAATAVALCARPENAVGMMQGEGYDTVIRAVTHNAARADVVGPSLSIVKAALSAESGLTVH